MLSSKESGFTLVEIVIVLSIAALILAGVLVFASQASQSSRDAQRRNAVSQAETALEQWAATHSGEYTCDDTGSPVIVSVAQLYGTDSCAGQKAQYLDLGVKDPSTGAQYASTTGVPAAGDMSINFRDAPINTNGYCVRVKLEAGVIYGATEVNKSGRDMTNGCN